MVKFLKRVIKKIFGSSQNQNFPPPAAPKIENAAIESAIDAIVEANIHECKNLLKMDRTTHYWKAVFKALAYAESALNPYTRYIEPPSLGKDAVTKRQNTSEGLLQLSYQDALYHGCEFDWNVDKNKADNDKSKTIFNTEKNIKCGMKIMDKLVSKKGNYIFDSGNYWAVLKPSNKRHKTFLKFLTYYLDK